MPALKNVITATITLYKIEEVSIYQSELISTNGNIFHPYDLDTQLNFRIYSSNEDITKQFLDIEWVKFSYDSNNVIEDREWGISHYGKDSITVSKEEIDKKCIIQANAYMFIKNKMTCVASSRLTLLDINELYSSTTPPDKPTDGFIWVNTSYNPPTIFSWNSALNKWVEVGKTTPFVRNLIHNSNFWKLSTENYIEDNSESLEPIKIVNINDKKWAMLKSSRQTLDDISAGLLQDTNYPIIKNSDYTLSFLAYKYENTMYAGNQIFCKIISINSKGENSNILTTLVPISSNKETQISVPFKTLGDTETIRCFIGVEPGMNCEFYITQLSLYNTDSYYPWELSPEDTQEQLQNKLDSDHLSVFNALTRNGAMEGIYINTDENGYEHYYFNASHLQTGSIDGGLINGIGLDIKDDATGESIFHVYKDENGTHIDLIANNLLIGQSRETASTINYVNSSMKTAETNAISSAESYTNGQITEVNKVVETKADTTTVDSLEERVTVIEGITEDSVIVGTVTGSEIYTLMLEQNEKKFTEHAEMIADLNDELDALEKDIEDNIKINITNKKIVEAVRSSQDYKKDLDSKLDVINFNTYKKDLEDDLSAKFSSVNSELNKKASDEKVNGIEKRVKTVEDNTQASAIISVVRQSKDYTDDLSKKVNVTDFTTYSNSVEEQFAATVKTSNVISKINSSSENLKISNSKLDISFEQLSDDKTPIEELYSVNNYSKNGISLGLSIGTQAASVDEIIDKIYFTKNGDFDLTLNIAGIRNTNYIKIPDTYANIYMNNNEMIKLLLYEIKNLKERVKELEEDNQ